jgi:hypothetical protein
MILTSGGLTQLGNIQQNQPMAICFGCQLVSVRVYLICYILCIIVCHIYRDIFGMIDIMYCRLPYISRGVLPLKTLVLYIYQPRGTM